jgi:hypothetical protein
MRINVRVILIMNQAVSKHVVTDRAFGFAER